MSEKSNIEWTSSTFNPWRGCTKVGPGCDHCYAERDAHRFGTAWGPGAERRFFGDDHWNKPRLWNAKAAKEQAADPTAQWRVFCASMADVFDNEAPQEVRARLWALIRETPNLTWLLLTKRIGNVAKMLPADWGAGYQNVWLGISVVNQEEADRDIPKLLRTPARLRWLSMEPLLGPVGIGEYLPGDRWESSEEPMQDALDWIVVGGESGPHARPMHPDWARSLRDQCAAAGVPFLFKQWGEWAPTANFYETDPWRDLLPDGTDYTYQRIDEFKTAVRVRRVGKKSAGRLLDGVQHDGYPEAR
jgi:protein gp37